MYVLIKDDELRRETLRQHAHKQVTILGVRETFTKKGIEVTK